MRNQTVVLLLLTIMAVAQAEEAKPEGLSGSWRVIATEGLGIRADGGSDGGPDEIWGFDKGVLTIRRPRHKEVVLTYRQNAKASPSEVDWTREARAGDPPPKPEPGIYKFEDGKLLICYCSGAPVGRLRQRPREFAGPVSKPEEFSFNLYIFEPVGKAPPK